MSIDKKEPQQQQQPQDGHQNMEDAAPPPPSNPTEAPAAAESAAEEDAITTTTTTTTGGGPATLVEQEQEQEQPDSPPLPGKHTAVTPGPRANRLQDLFASTLKHTLDKISRDNFVACYPTIAVRAPGTLEFVQRQMVERLGAQCNREFESVLQNRNVVAKLNELESLVSDAARRKQQVGPSAAATGEAPVPPHTLPASQILAAHLAPHLASQQSQLNAKLQNVQASNTRLFDEIQAQRAEIESLLASVEMVLADMDGANELLDHVVDDLAQETRTAEMDMDMSG
ncbi:Nnf1-domain-containing protein [Podospora didyma]|uniref:Nnf1-domain-containing protein n=1 Tax=Podospora didyma TaxID=330526 RepID=A0AAE0N2U5_9PEZI|nr:Nnf1-domain-containing protein [Podospora didyma]